VGQVELRAYDHQALLPMYLGVTKKSPQYKFLIADGIITIPPADAAPDLNEIKKARGQ